MDMGVRDGLITAWSRYFAGAELPVAFYYSRTERDSELVEPGSVPRCIIAALAEVRNGRSLAFSIESIGCAGGKRYLGFASEIRPEFEYFLSCGISGKVEGERYKKSPELVKQAMEYMPPFPAPAPFIIFKRWDKLGQEDDPDVAVFFATPDVLSGLFTLANFDEAEPNGVIAPFGSGCSTIVQSPYLEKTSHRQRAVIGLFDVSARPFVGDDILTFSVPMAKLDRMIGNAGESFLTTRSWAVIQKRIGNRKR
jgi:uncharacterized protein (DUF169 family)